MTDYKNMFEQSIRSLASIDDALGIGDDGCGDLEQTLYAIKELRKLELELDMLRFALENCRLLAARHRKEDWALLILGFCAEGGVTGSITR